MNKISLILIFLVINLISPNLFAQDTTVIVKSNSLKDNNFSISEFGLFIKRGSRILESVNNIDDAYLYNITNGFGIVADLSYYFNKTHGLTVDYNTLFTSGKLYNYNLYYLKYTSTLNEFYINNFNISYSYRNNISNLKNSCFRFQSGIGISTYKNIGVGNNLSQEIFGYGPTLTLKVFYDYSIFNNCALSLGLGTNLTSITNYKIDKIYYNNNGNIKFGASTLNIMIGLKFSSKY